MLAYHNDPAIKAKYLKRVRAHRQADELIHGATEGQTSEGFRGCAVVCTMNKYDHAAYETEIGLPLVLARLEDGIFEGLPQKESMDWPEAFLEAAPVGADLSGVKDLFLRWLLIDPVDGVIKYAKIEKARKSIQAVGDLYARKIKGEGIPVQDWKAAASAASAASAATAATAAYAASAATAAYAASAAYAAAAAVYAAAAADAARSQSRIRQSEKLLELLRAAPVIV